MKLMTDNELAALPVGSQMTFDTECYPNYWLAAFKPVGIDAVVKLELINSNYSPHMIDKLSWIMWAFELVGFNSKKYDQLMIEAALKRYTNEQLKALSDDIIRNELKPYGFEEKYKIKLQSYNHIDLIEVCPLQASLKTYGARLHCETIQDLPYDPDEALDDEMICNVSEYCVNDLAVTELVLNNLKNQLDLRRSLSKEYGVDLRSKSDAQIAECILSTEIERITGKQTKRPFIPKNYSFKYVVPDEIEYINADLNDLLNIIKQTSFVLSASGSVELPETLANFKIGIESSVYRIGIGGLHSSEECSAHISDDNHQLYDFDVASYYPQIILNQQLYPNHLGRVFLDVYKSIVDRRIAAKKAKDNVTADSLKITINGSFGKLGSKYSILYSPALLAQVTLSGQLYLLMLIDMLESRGIPVVSANTDGIVIKCPRVDTDLMYKTVKEWESKTGFTTEETKYKALYSRDVNNYIAVKDDSCKLKGTYSNPWNDPKTAIFRFHKNPVSLICIEAVTEFLINNTPIVDTVTSCARPEKFVTVRNVKGGAVKNGEYLGKVVRWYYSKNDYGIMQYASNGNKVPMSDGAVPINNLSKSVDMMENLNYDYYINAANEILADIGYTKKAKQLTLF